MSCIVTLAIKKEAWEKLVSAQSNKDFLREEFVRKSFISYFVKKYQQYCIQAFGMGAQESLRLAEVLKRDCSEDDFLLIAGSGCGTDFDERPPTVYAGKLTDNPFKLRLEYRFKWRGCGTAIHRENLNDSLGLK
jgi:hypothetical protein